MTIRDDQLIFLIGIAGSGWSKMDAMLRNCSYFKFNMSDYSSDRYDAVNTLDNGYYTEHTGHFLGPGTGYGEGFDNIPQNYQNKEEFKKEALRVYTDLNAEDNYIIKCHWFCEQHNLNWLKKEFPNNKIIFTVRNRKDCDDRWLECMTFNKSYPSYEAWMEVDDPNDAVGIHCEENISKFKSINSRHDVSIRVFLDKEEKKSVMFFPNRHTLTKLGYKWDENGENIFKSYVYNRVPVGLVRPPMWDTFLVFYNFDGFLFCR